MESDLSDIQKIELALGSRRDDSASNSPELISPADSQDGFSIASSYQQHLTPRTEDQSFSLIEDFSNLDSAYNDESNQSELVIDEIPACLENALALNQAYQAILEETLQQMCILLDVNKEKQKDLQDSIDSLVKKSSQKNSDKERTRSKKIHFSIFGAPYFKDEKFDCPPKNGDTITTETVGFHNVSLVCSLKPFNKLEDDKLLTAARAEARRLKVQKLSKKREKLKLQLASNPSITGQELASIQSEIQDLGRTIFKSDLIPDSQLFDDPDLLIDWEKISVQDFYQARSGNQIRNYWINYLCPAVYTDSWVTKENRQLRALVTASSGPVDWDELARNMDTDRSAFDCFSRYQSRYCHKHRAFGWTNEDNDKLVRIMQANFDTADNIDWNQVLVNFPGRTKNQVYSHWKYNIIVGDSRPFNKVEDMVIIEGVKIGFEMQIIALLLRSRNPQELRKRYQKLVSEGKVARHDWTPEEDKFLLELDDCYKLNNHRCRRFLHHRSVAQAVSRYHFLRMKQTDPVKYIASISKNKKQQMNWYKWKRETFCRKLSNLICHNVKMNLKYPHILHPDKPNFPLKNRKSNLVDLTPVVARAVRYDRSLRNQAGRPKRAIVMKERELRDIVRPLYHIFRRRQRVTSLPGDGRDHGLVLASYYRLLKCKFTRMPPVDSSAEDLDAAGIEPQDHLPFTTFQGLVKDLPELEDRESQSIDKEVHMPEEVENRIEEMGQRDPPLRCYSNAKKKLTSTRTNTPSKSGSDNSILCIPPVMHSLTGFRGLLLHRKYLQKCADKKEPQVQVNVQPASRPATPNASQQGAVIENQSAPGPDLCQPIPRVEAELPFGNAGADSSLLARMLTIFYWPGIMSTINVPDNLEPPPEPCGLPNTASTSKSPASRKKNNYFKGTPNGWTKVGDHIAASVDNASEANSSRPASRESTFSQQGSSSSRPESALMALSDTAPSPEAGETPSPSVAAEATPPAAKKMRKKPNTRSGTPKSFRKETVMLTKVYRTRRSTRIEKQEDGEQV